ncbi:LysR family transcriptional regulator [Luteibacter yeojuensis]|uniref:LysR family transcriptional regulator n=1 Tax=Luteibacter yeojuensis TaxID=345309 RepID=A0A7X5QSJ1_9GAMM|nr:LysR family transcriptional regulator [Luteibacter yeojuensis]NID14638.1 LysR family transcriptional regulator [Luteibacter yeojuensis]
MEWSDLRVFLAIAREGTLGAAARKLGQTQPTMGRRLQALEQAVGHTLFQRTKAGFVLNEEGIVVLGHAERMEEEVLAFQRQLTGQEQQLDGLLRLTASDWFAECVLTPVLADFAKQYPRVVIELLTDSRFYSLSRREADLAFRITAFDEPDVVSRKLLRMPYGVYAAKDHPVPQAGDGAGRGLITMDTAFGGMPDVAWLQRMLPNAHVAFRTNARAIQAQMCARGIGIAVLPRPLGDATDGLQIIDLGETPPARETWVGYHRDMRRLTRLRALLDLVVGRLAD